MIGVLVLARAGAEGRQKVGDRERWNAIVSHGSMKTKDGDDALRRRQVLCVFMRTSWGVRQDAVNRRRGHRQLGKVVPTSDGCSILVNEYTE